MGFFSWKTADTDESIANIHSGHKNAGRAVYLLQPGGREPIEETEYDGYGKFGGVDAFVWVARESGMGEIIGTEDEEALRMAGIAINEDADVYKDKEGTLHSFHFPISKLGIKAFEGNYGTIEPELGKTPSDLIRDGEWQPYKFSDAVKSEYPEFAPVLLKFSFDDKAVYENLPPSESCPEQGFFY